MNIMQNFLKGAEHLVASLVLFAAPILMTGNFGWMNLTIGAVLTGAYAWARASFTN